MGVSAITEVESEADDELGCCCCPDIEASELK